MTGMNGALADGMVMLDYSRALSFFDLKEKEYKQKIEELEKVIKELTEKNPMFENWSIQEEYKDRVFKFLFGNPEGKQWALSLHNAIHGTNYTCPDMISFKNIDDFIYMKAKQDAHFLVASDLRMWGTKVVYNPNMPLRFFLCWAKMFSENRSWNDLQEFRQPSCVCFYNGTFSQPEKTIRKLSEAYGGNGGIDVKVTMVIVSNEKNKGIMDTCKPLYEYAWLVEAIRKNQEDPMLLPDAADKAISAMPWIRIFIKKEGASSVWGFRSFQRTPYVLHPLFMAEDTVVVEDVSAHDLLIDVIEYVNFSMNDKWR